jgi:hypothetical protein
MESESKKTDGEERCLTISVDPRLVSRLEALSQAPELGFAGNLTGTIVAILYGGCNFHERRLRQLRGQEDRRL